MSGTDSLPTTSEIRADFPALSRLTGGGPVAYFDGPGGTQVPRRVVEAMVEYLYHHNANTHWAYPTSIETDAALADARAVFAAFLNGQPDEVAFGANMTTLTMHLARALARTWGAGDEIVVTELDHHANVDPWVEAARDRGLTIRRVRLLPEQGTLDWDDLATQLTPRTRLLAIGAASNALGTITDVAAAARLAHAAGALVFVDGVHYAPHQLPDVRALGCDAFACSAYKFYGPHVGVMWLARELFARTPFPRLVPASDVPPERAETGTLSHEAIVGAATAVRWLAGLAGDAGDLRARLAATFGALQRRGEALLRRLWDGLADVPGLRLFGPPPGAPRTPTVAFVVNEIASETLARRLGRTGVYVPHGDFYAHTVVSRLGLQPDGVVRAGCACYTSPEDVSRLLESVHRLAARESAPV
jgi:cysteine desulfurase family protein (TIGR01976 family)